MATDAEIQKFVQRHHGFIPKRDGSRMSRRFTRVDLVKGLTQTGADTPVAAAMTSHFDCAAPSEMLEGCRSARAGFGLSGPASVARTASWSVS